MLYFPRFVFSKKKKKVAAFPTRDFHTLKDCFVALVCMREDLSSRMSREVAQRVVTR